MTLHGCWLHEFGDRSEIFATIELTVDQDGWAPISLQRGTMNQNKRRFLSACALLGAATPLANACGPLAPPGATPTSAPQPGATPTSVTQTSGPRAASTLALRPVRAASTMFAPLELAIDTDGLANNPYDPDEIDMHVQFAVADGPTITVPAFFFQDFDPVTLQPVGSSEWRVRFTPPQAGAWQAQAALANPAITSTTLDLNVAAAEQARGFVRISKANPHYFAFDNGAPYLPIGLNLGWSTAPPAGMLADYERWIGKLSQNGGSFARVWMPAWGFGLEWNDTGLGNYTKRLRQAWMLDRVFQIAETHGVYLMLCLINHGQFSTSTNPEWRDNPYNQANGGPLAAPQEFATNSTARNLFKRRLRYIAARWAYAPSLFSWEWWNEVNWTPIDDTLLKPWIIEMTAELKRYDPYNHLISTSHANGTSFSLWKMPELDYIQHHDYSAHDLARSMPVTFRALARKAPNKPVLLSELGFSAAGQDDTSGGESIHMHNGIWAAPFSGFAGSAMHWWWDTFVDKADKWPEYKSLADFLVGENLADLTPGTATISALGPVGLTLQREDHALLWLRSGGYDAGEAAYAQAKAAREQPNTTATAYQPLLQTAVSLSVADMRDGTYTVRWYDPQRATWLEEQSAQSSGGTLMLTAPSFTRDLAAKIESVAA